MVMSCHQNTGKNHNLVANKSLEYVAKFEHFRTVINQNHIHKEIKNRLNSGYAYYQSIQSFHLPISCIKT
jgi:hypothetical protein